MPFEKGNKLGGRKHGALNKLTRHGISSGEMIILKSFYEKLIGNIKSELYYVYEHCYNGECFYVGKGIAGRAWDFNKGSRNDVWAQYMEAINNKAEVNIIACGLSEEEALLTEKAIISLRNPVCNIVHSTDQSQSKLF